MPGIFGSPLPDNHDAGVSFEISKAPLGDHHFELAGFRAELIAGQKRLHVVLRQKSAGSTMDQLIEQALPVAQDFLDHLAVQQQLSYRILGSEDCIIWERIGDRYKFEIRTTLSVTSCGSVTAQLVRPDGTIQPPEQSRPSLQAKAFRYYRFASSSEDLFEAYRYLWLCFESALHDFYPRQKKIHRTDEQWLKDALQRCINQHSLDLSPFSTTGSNPVDAFYAAHYQAIRCATFHAKNKMLLPGNPKDVKEVQQQLLLFQPIVIQLFKGHFKTRFTSAGITSSGMDKYLRSAVPVLRLATTPQEANVAQEIQTALLVAGYFDALPKRAEDVESDTEEKLKQLIENARSSFPFDLTEITLDGKRSGYDDEWIIMAETTGNAFTHRTIRSIALCPLLEPLRIADPFLIGTVVALTNKTVSTDLDLPEDCNLKFRIRVALRYAQQFPRDFVSS